MGEWSAHKSGETEATGGVTRGDGAGLFRVRRTFCGMG